MKKIANCSICSVEFSYKWRHDRDRKFCSIDCIRKESANKRSRTCKICSVDFLLKSYSNPGIFCSRKCQFLGQKVDHMYANDQSKLNAMKLRFDKYVVKNEKGCWGWLGVISHYNYALLQSAGKKIVASRASWIIHKGPIPDGLFICHKCDNPPCTNPDHLFLGTQKDNMGDCLQKGRHSGYTKGIISRNRKITNEIAKEIRTRLQNKESHRSIASRLKIALHIIEGISSKGHYKN